MYQFNAKQLPVAISNIIDSSLNTIKSYRSTTMSNMKTTSNTGNFAFDMIHNWNKFNSPIKNKKYSPLTAKEKIKTYLQTFLTFHTTDPLKESLRSIADLLETQ